MKKKIRKEITDNLVMLVQKGDITIQGVYLMYNTKNVTELYFPTVEKYPKIDSYTSHSKGVERISQGFAVVDVLNESEPMAYNPTIIEFEGHFDTLMARGAKDGIKVVLIRKTKKEPVFLFEMRKTKK